MEKVMEAFTDNVIDAVTISTSREFCRQQLRSFEGTVDQVLFVNVNYSGTSQEALLTAFKHLIEAGRPRNV